MDKLFKHIVFFTPLIVTVACVLLFLFSMKWLILDKYPELAKERRLSRQLSMLGLTLAGVVVIAFALPVEGPTRNQVITLIGVMLSGVVAFSSTTIVANFMAGIMLRLNKPFKTGDFISVGEHFGRISERGLLDTEIQSEHRELISLPNMYLISNPVVVTSSTGAIVSVSLSLGYDIHHSRIQSLLIAAARKTGLDEPFVQIIELGNYAITYHVSGLLTDAKSILTTRSNLHGAVLDALHNDGVEIVSPTFMNQRRIGDQVAILPQPTTEPNGADSSKPEDIMFDKAEQAEKQEEAEQGLQNEIQELENQSKIAEGNEKQRIKDLISRKRTQVTELDKSEKQTIGDSQQVSDQNAPADADKPPQ